MRAHIVDYGIGNIGSLMSTFSQIGVKAILTNNPEEIYESNLIVLPGVGAFDPAINLLREKKLAELLHLKSKDSRSLILGICLGMQLLMDSSEEGLEAGVGLIRGKVRSLKNLSSSARVPVLGWREVTPTEVKSSRLRTELGGKYYFAHSYFVHPERQEIITHCTRYDLVDIPAVIEDCNVIGIQFHPERSGYFGLSLLQQLIDRGFANGKR